jgi:hypothetical protein
MFRHRDLVVLFSNKYNNFLWGPERVLTWSRDATQICQPIVTRVTLLQVLLLTLRFDLKLKPECLCSHVDSEVH